MQTLGALAAPEHPQNWGSCVRVRTLRGGVLRVLVALLRLPLEDTAEQHLVGGAGLVDDDGVGGRPVECEGALLGPGLRVGVALPAGLELAVLEARDLRAVGADRGRVGALD